MNNPNTTTQPLNIISALIVAIALVTGAVLLKTELGVNEVSFSLFILASLFIGLFICYSNRIHTFEVAQCKLILKDLKQTEVSMKDLALATVELVEAGTAGSIATHEYDEDRYKKAKQAVMALTTT